MAKVEEKAYDPRTTLNMADEVIRLESMNAESHEKWAVELRQCREWIDSHDTQNTPDKDPREGG